MSNPGAVDGNSSLTQSILNEDLSGQWVKYRDSGLLSAQEFGLITSYVQDHSLKARIAKLESTPTPPLLIKLLSFHDNTVVKYSLALIDEALQGKPGLGSLFSDPSVFIGLLKDKEKSGEQFVTYKACRILSHLFTYILDPPQHEAETHEFLSLLVSESLQHQEVMLFSLQLMLRNVPIRKQFGNTRGLERLQLILNDPEAPLQVLYQTIFCLWLVSFDKDIAASMGTIITRLVPVARQSQKEKIIRISLATLKNLAVHPKNVEKMVESRLQKQLEVWGHKKWGDEDIRENLEFLTKAVEHMIDEMSSFERFWSEALSGEMEWSPVHFSETFWRDNISRLAENNFEVIRVLSQLLTSEQSSPQTKAVVCYDIGEFVRLHPAGRKVVTELGTKTTIMAILYEPGADPDLQKQALLCTRKMMVSNWEKPGAN